MRLGDILHTNPPLTEEIVIISDVGKIGVEVLWSNYGKLHTNYMFTSSSTVTFCTGIFVGLLVRDKEYKKHELLVNYYDLQPEFRDKLLKGLSSEDKETRDFYLELLKNKQYES